MILCVKNLVKTYGAQTVLSDVSFLVHAHDHMGVVGPNGVGKSTLLNLLVNRESPDGGTVSFSRNTEVGHLPQTLPDVFGKTIQDLLMESVGSLRRLEERMRELEREMNEASQDRLTSTLDEYGEASGKYEARGGYDTDRRIGMVLNGLSLAYLSPRQEVHRLSGGEKARIQLASLLIQAPDLLLLDEPTNHLDNASLDWLETYLLGYRGAVLAVSHDRRFLNRTVQSILEIDEHSHKLRWYPGNYEAYVKAKDGERAKWVEDYTRQQEEIKELNQSARGTATRVGHDRPPPDGAKLAYDYRGARAQQAISHRTRDALERLRRIQEKPVPRPPKPMKIIAVFDSGERMESDVVISAEGIVKFYGGRCILHGVGLTMTPSSRILLTGPNGAGKTTLLRILMGAEMPDHGAVRVVSGTRIGYLPQEPTRDNLDKTVLSAYRDGMIGYEEDFVADLLRYGLFAYEDLVKTVDQLSIGQRRKLEIARLIAASPHILLLDEPTNHISLDVLEAFEKATMDFAGPVLAVSHDRWFMERFGGEVWQLADGRMEKLR